MSTTFPFEPRRPKQRIPFRAALDSQHDCCSRHREPIRHFVVQRCHGGDVSLVDDIEILIRYEPEIFKRSHTDIERYLKDGEMIAILERTDCGRLKLAAVSIYQIFDFVEGGMEEMIIEIGLTVVSKARRRWGLSEVASSAALIHALSIHGDVFGIVNTFRETNAACEAANHRVYSNVSSFLAARQRFPGLAAFQTARRLRYIRDPLGPWTGSAKIALMTQRTYRAAVSAMTAAASATGYRLPGGHRVELGPGWCSPGFANTLHAMKNGWTPDVELWRESSPSLNRSA